VDLGKPAGLPRPREGRRDGLREINGLSQLDESTLNNLGIYHFEQIARWTAGEVAWLEDHAFARGRIGRENWQAQARELAKRRPPTSRLARL
jgi:NADH-quinone oxidoreductase subunit E